MEDKNVIAFELKKSGLEKEIAGCLTSIGSVHIAFSLEAENREVWAKALKVGVGQLSQNGRLDEILSFYELKKEAWLSTSMPVQQ